MVLVEVQKAIATVLANQSHQQDRFTALESRLETKLDLITDQHREIDRQRIELTQVKTTMAARKKFETSILLAAISAGLVGLGTAAVAIIRLTG